MIYLNANDAWVLSLENVLDVGGLVSPRGMKTREVLSNTVICDMQRPVVTEPSRKLSYKFMAAEAYWILSGQNDVASIAKYNERIALYSDDGQTFFGAYGPRIKSQLPGVIEKLCSDVDSRQAGLTIWRENPPASKDVPCTVAIWFMVRNHKLDVSVFMRSNDRWLGTPYDIFNFSMLGSLVCAHLNMGEGLEARKVVEPGALRLTAASGHLYEKDWEAATRIAIEKSYQFTQQKPVPQSIWLLEPGVLLGRLRTLRDSKPGDSLRWWE